MPPLGRTDWRLGIDDFCNISDGVTRNGHSRLSRLLCRWWDNDNIDIIRVQQDPVADSEGADFFSLTFVSWASAISI